MAKIKGTITKASKGKFGYFVMLDGNDFYFNTKFKPKGGEGDVVGIEYDPKGPTRGQIKRMEVLTANTGGYDSSNSETGGGSWDSGGSSSSKSSGAGGGGNRQDSIIWQSCQKVAAELVKAEVSAGCLATSGSKDSKSAEIKGRFDELVVSMFEDASDPKSSETWKEIKGIQKDASGDDDSWGDTKGDDEWDDSGDPGDEWS